MKNMEFLGTDNPTGTALTPGQLSAGTSLNVPLGGTSTIPINHTGGNTGVILSDIQFTGTNAGSFVVASSGFHFIPVGGSFDLEIEHVGAEVDESATMTLVYGDGSFRNLPVFSRWNTI